MPEDDYEKVMNLAKRRGFVYPSFEIYGGAAGLYEYGPLGSVVKRRIQDEFRRIFVHEEGCVEIEAPTVTPAPVFVASGHVERFTDPVVKCTQCQTPFRADHLVEEAGFEGEAGNLSLEAIEAEVASRKIVCPNCKGAFGVPYHQNLMFATELGPGTGQTAYLRPETAQGMFVSFPTLLRHFRERLPFGAIQMGRAYRNEISPRQGVLRLREFNQMELEYFVDPKKTTHPGFRKVKGRVMTFVPNTTGKAVEMTIGDAVADGMVCHALLGYWLTRVQDLLEAVGVDPKRLRFRQHGKTEMAHYARDCWDAEFLSSRFGWVECVGVADRSAFDLTQHSKHSGVRMTALRRFKEPKRVKAQRFVPIHAKLGPVFRQKAKAVAEALAAVPEDKVKAHANGPFTLQVGSERLQVPQDAFETKLVEEVSQGEEFVPNVIEPSFGVDRILYAALEHCHHEQAKEDGPYTILRLPAAVAPVEVAVLPLMAKDGLDARATKLEAKLRRAGLRTQYDDSGSIGRRYARQDEIGTPLCVTVDFETKDDKSVTVRARDTGAQERVPMGRLVSVLRKRLSGAA
jgi:glycyl-tRNA synthetase